MLENQILSFSSGKYEICNTITVFFWLAYATLWILINVKFSHLIFGANTNVTNRITAGRGTEGSSRVQAHFCNTNKPHVTHVVHVQFKKITFPPVFRIRIRIHRIPMFLGLPDPGPDPLVKGH
jgi:hypothetical protein